MRAAGALGSISWQTGQPKPKRFKSVLQYGYISAQERKA